MKKRKILLGLAMAAMSVFTLASCGDDTPATPGTNIVDNGGTDNPGTDGQGNTGGTDGQGQGGGTEGQGGGTEGQGGGTQGQGGGTDGQGGGTGGQGGTTGGSTSNVDESNVVSENPGEVVTSGEITVLASAGKNEGGTITFNKVDDADSYNIYVDGNKVDEKIAYTQVFSTYARTDLFGLKAGNHNVEIAAVKDGNESNGIKTKVSLNISAYDRSGYAHFKNTEGVGGYNDDGTLKENAIVLYVTDDNKNSVELSYKGKTVRGIGNILNSVGQACGETGHETECKKVSNGKTYYGKGNTNQGILLDLVIIKLYIFLHIK